MRLFDERVDNSFRFTRFDPVNALISQHRAFDTQSDLLGPVR